MTIAEKIEKSRIKTIFTLYREGLFYKCFNEDAMVFVKKVREYKVSYGEVTEKSRVVKI